MKISNEREIGRLIPRLYLALLVLFVLDILLAISPGTIRNHSVLRSFYTGLIEIIGVAMAFFKEYSLVWEHWTMALIQIVPWLGLILTVSLWYRGYSIFRLEKINGFLEIENRSFVWELLGIVSLRKSVSIQQRDLISLRLQDRGFRKSLAVLFMSGGRRSRKVFTVSYLRRTEREKLSEVIALIIQELDNGPAEQAVNSTSFTVGNSNQVHSA